LQERPILEVPHMGVHALHMSGTLKEGDFSNITGMTVLFPSAT
jgi:hypothetical protein